MWFVYALLGAVFAALTSILAKIGIQNISSHLATAIRTVVVLVMAWGITLVLGQHKQLHTLTQRNWWFLILSGVATGLSWIFFYRALQLGDASKVVSVDKLSVVFTLIFAVLVLREPLTAKSLIGGVLVSAGVIVMALK